MERIKQTAAGTYTLAVSTLDDSGAVPTVTAPAVVVTDGAGVALTGLPAPSVSSGSISVSIPVASMPKLDVYHCEWTGTVSGKTASWPSDHELVGGHLCEIAAIRASDSAFADPVRFPTATLRAVRDSVADMLEGDRYGRVNFAPRGLRRTINGSGPDFFRGYTPLLYGHEVRKLQLPDVAVTKLYSCNIFGVDLTSDELATIVVGDSFLYRSAMYPPWPFGVQNIALHYVAGYARTPGPISRAATLLCREYLIASPLPSRATATSIGDQMFRVTVAGRDGATGIPDIDSAVEQFGRKHYVVG